MQIGSARYKSGYPAKRVVYASVNPSCGMICCRPAPPILLFHNISMLYIKRQYKPYMQFAMDTKKIK